jgi:hypothetical protein
VVVVEGDTWQLKPVLLLQVPPVQTKEVANGLQLAIIVE